MRAKNLDNTITNDINSYQKQHYFFTCCIEGDLLICAGISKILREKSTNVTTTLLLPEHPRVKDKMDDYYRCFDKIIFLPFSQPMKNVYRGMKTCLLLIKKIKRISVPRNSIFFMFSVYEFSEMLIYSFITAKKDPTIRRICISAFESGENQPNNVSIQLKSTVFVSIYSLIFSGKPFFIYRTRNSNEAGIHYFPTAWDFELCIGNSMKTRSEVLSVIYNIPYPVIPLIYNFLEGDNPVQLIKEESFIILISFPSGQIDILATLYWTQLNNLIEYLENNFPYKIFVKNHPGFGHDIAKWISNKNVNYINPDICAEDIYLRNLQNIKGVFGYGSTGLITASLLGIKSYHVSFLNEYGSIKERLNKFLKIAPDVVHIENLHDLCRINIKDDNVDVKRLSLQVNERWGEIIDIISRPKGAITN